MIGKISDVPDLVKQGRGQPAKVFPRIRQLAASEHWQEREVAATALVEIGKKQPSAVVTEMLRWVKSADPNIRRASCEGLRGLVRVTPDLVAPILDTLRADTSVYVRKSVANLLRDASKKHPAFVLGLCRKWAASADHHTRWVIRQGLRKLQECEGEQTASILNLIQSD